MLYLIVWIALCGLALYLVNRFVPMENNIRTILNWVVIIALILYILQAFGVLGLLNAPPPVLHR